MSGRIVKQEESKGLYLPILGNIKIGELVQRGNTTFPTSLDYFKADPKSRYCKMFHDKLGAEPRSIKISFISDDFSEVCNERWECWNNGKSRGFKFGYGDGVNYFVFDPKAKDYVPIKKSDSRFEPFTRAWEWQITLTMRFVALELPGVMGQWQLTTRGSNSSIPNIIKTFDTVLQQAGTVRGLPFDLTISKQNGKSMNSDGAISKKIFPVISLIPNFSEENVKAVKNYLAAGGNPSQVAMLTMDFKQLNSNNQNHVNQRNTSHAGESEQPKNTSHAGGSEQPTINITTSNDGGDNGGNAGSLEV